MRAQSSIWLHAVSVGEIASAKELIKVISREYPDKRLLISTVTPTGNKIAKTIAAKEDIVTYLPLDVSFIIKRFIKRFNPCIFIALESEIWPNLIVQLSRNSIAKVILNGRVSKAAFEKYRFFGPLLKSILKKIDYFAMQNKEYSSRILQLGVAAERIEISGNMKFDAQMQDGEYIDPEAIRKGLRLQPDETLFVCGCTHEGEEKIILSVYKDLIEVKPNLCLLIAPRHIERVKELEKLVSDFGFIPVRVSQLSNSEVSAKTVCLLDTIGRLKNYYSASTLCFVGGSLVCWGGHNILEPAYFAKPIIFGRYMHNFSDIRDLFLENRAAIEVEDEQGLKASMLELLSDNAKASQLGLKAKQVVDNNKGATARNAAIIKRFLK